MFIVTKRIGIKLQVSSRRDFNYFPRDILSSLELQKLQYAALFSNQRKEQRGEDVSFKSSAFNRSSIKSRVSQRRTYDFSQPLPFRSRNPSFQESRLHLKRRNHLCPVDHQIWMDLNLRLKMKPSVEHGYRLGLDEKYRSEENGRRKKRLCELFRVSKGVQKE